MKIHKFDVSTYPAEERPFRALMHWKKLFPNSTSMRIGVNDRVPTIAENQFGDRLEIQGLEYDGWNIDFQWRHKSKIQDIDIQDLYAKGCEKYKEGYRNSCAILASIFGLSYKPWLQPSVLETIENLKASTDYVKNTKQNVEARVLSDIQLALDKLNAGFNVKSKGHGQFVWESSTRYGTNIGTDKMAQDIKQWLPLNTRDFVVLNKTGGQINIPENLFDWKPMPAHLAEEQLMKAKGLSILDEKPPEHYVESLYKPENFTWLRNSFLQGDGEHVLLSDDNRMYALGSTFSSITPTHALVKEGLELLELAQQGQLTTYHTFNTIAPDAITSFAIHLHERALRLEKEALLPQEFKTPDANQNVFPKALATLDVGDHCAAGSDNQHINWCRVIAKKENIATLWIINGEWAFDVDLVSGNTLPHSIAKGVDNMRVLSTASTPYEGVDSHYNQAIEYYRNMLNTQANHLDLNSSI